ncbi:MAG: hypothetical protein E2O29_01835 [Deltaproteobacteria bacterium]|nr:MAG: hypothetical protein E2O29_01835 [Deltaproteobacteria bacterium]
MKIENEFTYRPTLPTTYCHTCRKEFHHLGIARHRAMHRDKKEDCRITFTNGDTYTWDYSNEQKQQDKENSTKTR